MWALNHLRHTYSSTEPVTLPEAESPTLGTAPTASPVTTPDPTSGTPLEATPTPAAPRVEAANVQARWKAFERAAKRGEKASINLSAAEINTLIAAESNLRGKVFVSMQGNVGRVQVSVPLKGVVFMGGRYLNGEASVQASPDGDPDKAQITDITLGNQSVPDSVLDQRLFGWSSMRGMIQQWLDEENIGVFKIENGQVLGETRGP